MAVSVGATGGYFAGAASSMPSSIVNVEPTRILDTRDVSDLGLAGPFSSGVSLDLQITGSVPTAVGDAVVVPMGATGVILAVTTVNPQATGFVSIRPADSTGPITTSNLNFTAGQRIANTVNVALPTGGTDAGAVEITYDAFGATGPSTDLIIDVTGYTTAATSGGGGVDADTLARISALEAEVIAVESRLPTVTESFSEREEVWGFPESVQQGLVNASVPGRVIVSVSGGLNMTPVASPLSCQINHNSSPGEFKLTGLINGGVSYAFEEVVQVDPGLHSFDFVCSTLVTFARGSMFDVQMTTLFIAD